MMHFCACVILVLKMNEHLEFLNVEFFELFFDIFCYFKFKVFLLPALADPADISHVTYDVIIRWGWFNSIELSYQAFYQR